MKSDLDKYLQLRIKELKSQSCHADYDEMKVLSRIGGELEACLMLLRREEASSITVKDHGDGTWTATINEFSFKIERIFKEPIYRCYLIKEDYFRPIRPKHDKPEFQSIEEVLTRIRELYEEGIKY